MTPPPDQSPPSANSPNIPTSLTRRIAVGIDLGTTFSAIAHVDEYGKAQIIPNSENERVTPSVILFENERVIVGTAAKQNAIAEPENSVEFVKREMGKPASAFGRTIGDQRFSAPELSSFILKKLRQDAEKYLGKPIEEAVITVPAYFNDPERRATIRAGELAGLKVLQVINEPTAAALAYGLDRLNKDQTVFVFDLGGGTFDVTIMRIERGGIRVLATNGDHRLGGKEWDDIIVNLMAEQFDREHGSNPLLDLQSYQELQTRAVSAKIQLSNRERAAMVHSYGGDSSKVDLTREHFEKLSADLIERCKAICEIVMSEAKADWSSIDRVLMVGGMTRMPMVRKLIETISGKPPLEEVSPDEVVACGAAVQAMLCILKEEEAKADKSTAPSGALSEFYGQDGKLIEVSNITSHTLGVVLWDEAALCDYVFPMIRKMTPFPVEVSNRFGTASANMEKVIVQIVEGESSVPTECHALGQCQVELPEYLPKGSQVELIYRYDANQVLHVVAKAGGRESQAEISSVDDGDKGAADLTQIPVG